MARFRASGSPIIWGDRVFLSGGDEAKREVLCFRTWPSRKTALGKPRAEKPRAAPMKPPLRPRAMRHGRRDRGHRRAPRLCHVLPMANLAAFNFDGTLVWSKFLPLAASKESLRSRPPRCSLAGPRHRAHSTGRPRRQSQQNLTRSTARPAQSCGSSRAPVGAIVGHAHRGRCRRPGADRSTLAVPLVHRLRAERWRGSSWRRRLPRRPGPPPSPIFAGRHAVRHQPTPIACKPSAPTATVTSRRPHTSGWGVEDGIPDVTSPVSNGELLFLLDSSGVLTCYDAKDGKKQWQHDFGDECKRPRPASLATRLYVFHQEGRHGRGRRPRESSRASAHSSLGEEGLLPAPAFAAETRFSCAEMKHLICIGRENCRGQPKP